MAAQKIFSNDFLALNYEPFIYTLDGRFEKKTMLETGNNYLFIPEEKIKSEVPALNKVASRKFYHFLKTVLLYKSANHC